MPVLRDAAKERQRLMRSPEERLPFQVWACFRWTGSGQRVSANRGPLSGRSLFNHDVIYRTHVVYRNQRNVKDKGMAKKEMHIPNNRLKNQ